MASVSMTTVGAFQTAGAIMIVSLIVGPPATAYPLTDRLHVMLLLAPEQGVIAGIRRRASQAREFAETMLTIYPFNHEHSAEESRENRVVHLNERLRWTPERAREVVRLAVGDGLVRQRVEVLELPQAGRTRARDGMAMT